MPPEPPEDEDSEEVGDATGYTYTHWDCPFCDFDHQTESDVKGEVMECEDCGRKVRIR